jgi:hypothetical protein
VHDAGLLLLARHEQFGDDPPRTGRDRGRHGPAVTPDHLGVQPRPRLVAIALVRIAARQAGRASGYHQGADRRRPAPERDREMGDVVAQMSAELQSSGSAGNEHHDDISGS